jgi:hypothetical protein
VNDPYPGECNLYVDANGDGLCDLSQVQTVVEDGDRVAGLGPESSSSSAVETAPSIATTLTACPLGLVNDPFPGECRRYVDENQNGLCDLSEPSLIASGEIAVLPLPTPQPTLAPGLTPSPRPTTACPYGLVNDPYPGECRQYTDKNGDGICDLSQPELIASSAVALPSGSITIHSGNNGGQQQRRRGGQNK